MGVYQIHVWLSVSHPAGTPIAPEDFALSLGVETGANEAPYTVNGLNTRWANASLEVCQLHRDDFNGYDEPTEAFFAAAESALQQFAQWLTLLPVGRLDEWRERGFQLGVWIYGWIAQDQFELKLPCELMAELGLKKLPLQLMTEGQ